jgi:hypothetical protein
MISRLLFWETLNAMKKNSIAFGAPGIEPRWASSAKDGIGLLLILIGGGLLSLDYGERL